jgi:predicted transcriptional regulator
MVTQHCTQAQEPIRRTVPLNIKISPRVAARLDAIARPRGLTSATMGALAVGEYVERYERQWQTEEAATRHSDREP